MEDTEFSTPFSTNFFTDFSSEFSGFEPSSLELTPVTDNVTVPDITQPQVIDEKEKFEKSYQDFIKSEKLKKINRDLQNMERMNEDWNKKYKSKEEERIIKQHKAKYKEYIDEYNQERENSTIEFVPSNISNYPRVDAAFDLLYRGIDRNTEEIAKSIGCIIKGQTLYPIDWTKEEVEELNRRLKQ